jgi:hypothetical protein
MNQIGVVEYWSIGLSPSIRRITPTSIAERELTVEA